MILSMMLTAVTLFGWAANDGKTLKIKLDIVVPTKLNEGQRKALEDYLTASE